MTTITQPQFDPFKTYSSEQVAAANKIQKMVSSNSPPVLSIRRELSSLRDVAHSPILCAGVMLDVNDHEDIFGSINHLLDKNFSTKFHGECARSSVVKLFSENFSQSFREFPALLPLLQIYTAEIYLSVRTLNFEYADMYLNNSEKRVSDYTLMMSEKNDRPLSEASARAKAYSMVIDRGEGALNLASLFGKAFDVTVMLHNLLSDEPATEGADTVVDYNKIVDMILNPESAKEVTAAGKPWKLEKYIDQLMKKIDGMSTKDKIKTMKVLIVRSAVIGGISRGEQIFRTHANSEAMKVKTLESAREIFHYMLDEGVVQSVTSEAFNNFSKSLKEDRLHFSELLSHLQAMFGTLEEVPEAIKKIAVSRG